MGLQNKKFCVPNLEKIWEKLKKQILSWLNNN